MKSCVVSKLSENYDFVAVSEVKSIYTHPHMGVSMHCFRAIQCYREGLIGPELDYAVRKYHGHRKIPSDQIALVKDEYAIRANKKRRVEI